MRVHRIQAFFLRHLYPLQRDLDLLTDMIYWPLIDTALWGITGQWLVESSGSLTVVSSILMALVLWNVIWRSQAEVSRNLMDEIWNNNLVNLFSTPLTLQEWVVGVVLLSILKTLMTLSILIPAILVLYSVNIISLGWWLLLFFVFAAMTGWWLGFISAGIVLRYGQKVQTVIWTLPSILLPFSAVFFPVDRLPEFAQGLSRFIPTTVIFETMRSLVAHGSFSVTALVTSFALNLLYLGLAIWYFKRSFHTSLNLGLSRFD